MAPFVADDGEWALLATPQARHTSGIPAGFTQNKRNLTGLATLAESAPGQGSQNGHGWQKWWHNAGLTGSVAERLKAPVLKTGEGLRPS